MKLYHGSNVKVHEIDLTKSRPAKDFGRAFYLSECYDQAVEMAKFKAETFGGKIVINEFDFDENVLSESDMKIMRFDAYTDEWARFVLTNRASRTTFMTTILFMALLLMTK